MAANQRVAVQHEDWLNLADPEAPWFSLPVLKRAFPNGLDRTSAEIRAEHKIRWYGGDGTKAARTAPDRGDYLDWVLRDVLRWGESYRTGSQLPAGLAAGVTRHDVTVIPTGVYQPAASAPVGLFEDPVDGQRDGDGQPRLLVFALPSGTDPRESPIADTWPATWVQRAALSCRHNGVALALVTDGDHLTLVHAPAGAATGWGSWRASEFATEPILLDSFCSMLHAGRFIAVGDKDTPESLLTESAGTQAEVTNQLGSQVRKATELLVNAISRANLDRGGHLLDGVEPHEVYEASVTAMMRLVFLLVAEENDLLPVDNADYQQLYAIRTLRESLLAERFENPEALETRTTAWHRLLATSRAVHSGVHHEDLAVPAYGGNLFDPDRFGFLEGRRPDESWRTSPGTPIPVTDLDILAILDALLVLRFTSAGGVTDTRRLSYRQVDVEQIGHIYERLLDHDAVQTDHVVLGLKGRSGDEPEVKLADLESKRIDGEKVLLSFLTDKDGKYVGTAKQITKLLADPVDSALRAGLLQACHGDLALVRRIEPFANLVRPDLRDRPMVFLPGAVYVTETGSRRDSGTAYTTRELADEVAEHALAPLCYSPGPQDTADTNEWRIMPSAALLELKVCDPAVGSGAILVAACRYLAERLIEAWRAEGDPRSAETATAADDPTRLDVVVEARRLVAEHCCYGVDRNPMAVEMAKLSMWLTTVAKDRPFTFLDHALKAGDSLLGMRDIDQLRNLHYDVAAGRTRNIPIAGWSSGGDALRTVTQMVDDALDLRRQVRAIDSQSPADIEHKQALNFRSEQKLLSLTAIADLVTGAALATAGERNAADALTARLDVDLHLIGDLVDAAGTPSERDALEAAVRRGRLRLDAGRPPHSPERRPLHWPIVFPEVFSSVLGGFDCMLGNPPFLGGSRISAPLGTDYRHFICTYIAGMPGNRADLVGYFFLEAFRLLRRGGTFGFIATKTISEADTRLASLEVLSRDGGTIYRAVSSQPWPGDAGVHVAIVWVSTAWTSDRRTLDNREVTRLTTSLSTTARDEVERLPLAANAGRSLLGSLTGGIGFVIDASEAADLIGSDRAYLEVVRPFMSGEDIAQRVNCESNRWAIDFRDRSLHECTERFPLALDLVESRVKPQRDAMPESKRRLKEFWWQYEHKARSLYEYADSVDRLLVCPRVSKYTPFALVNANQIFNTKVVGFLYDSTAMMALLGSQVHFLWSRDVGGHLKSDPVYDPKACFDTFPLPERVEELAQLGLNLDHARTAMMESRRIGLTGIMNLVSDPSSTDDDVALLRGYIQEIESAVFGLYGLAQLDPTLTFNQTRYGMRFTLNEDCRNNVLDALAELNRGEASRAPRKRRPKSAATNPAQETLI